MDYTDDDYWVYFGYDTIGKKLLRGECNYWVNAVDSTGLIFEDNKINKRYIKASHCKNFKLKIKLSHWKEGNYNDYILSHIEMRRAITYKAIK